VALVKSHTLCKASAEIIPSFNVHTAQCLFTVFLALFVKTYVTTGVGLHHCNQLVNW